MYKGARIYHWFSRYNLIEMHQQFTTNGNPLFAIISTTRYLKISQITRHAGTKDLQFFAQDVCSFKIAWLGFLLLSMLWISSELSDSYKDWHLRILCINIWQWDQNRHNHTLNHQHIYPSIHKHVLKKIYL